MAGGRYSDARVFRAGVFTLVVMAVIATAAFNLGKFPGFRDKTYHAEFADAGGLHPGSLVQIGGIRVGRVDSLTLDGDRVRVAFQVDSDVTVGEDSAAAVGVLNMLGEKYLEVSPAGPGELGQDDVIPLERTTSSYDVVAVLGQLTTTTEAIDTDQLTRALSEVSTTVDAAAPEIEASFEGLSRLSRTVASRNEEISTLLDSSRAVSKVLADRSQDLVDLMQNSSLVFEEVEQRREVIHQLLVNARQLARHLRGVAEDNQAEIGPALEQVRQLTTLLNDKDQQLKDTLHAFGPYTAILGNIIGTGPWFDAYLSNLVGIFSGEFVPMGGNP